MYRVNANSGKKVVFQDEICVKTSKADIVMIVEIIAMQIEYEQGKMLEW